MSDLGNIKWIFSKTNGIDDIANLKDKVLKALKKADGTPVDELENLFKANPVSASEKFSTLFGKRIRNPDDIIDVLNDNSVFNKLFEIVE